MIQSVVEIGEQRRKREAMDSIISEIVKGSDENVPNTLRMAIEVSSLLANTCIRYLFFDTYCIRGILGLTS